MTLVNADTGNVGRPFLAFTKDEARSHTAKINAAIGITGDLVIEAWERRIWTTLGHRSWEEYCSAEVAWSPNAAARAVLMVGLRNAGASYRAIGSASGVSPQTAMRHLAGVPNGTPAEPNDSTDDPPEPIVIGTDGKTYPATRITETVAETVTEVDPTPEPANDAVTEFIEADPNLPLMRYRAALCKDIAAAGRLFVNDPERVALSANVDRYGEELVWKNLDTLRQSFDIWFARLETHRPKGLRVVKGGQP